MKPTRCSAARWRSRSACSARAIPSSPAASATTPPSCARRAATPKPRRGKRAPRRSAGERRQGPQKSPMRRRSGSRPVIRESRAPHLSVARGANLACEWIRSGCVHLRCICGLVLSPDDDVDPSGFVLAVAAAAAAVLLLWCCRSGRRRRGSAFLLARDLLELQNQVRQTVALLLGGALLIGGWRCSGVGRRPVSARRSQALRAGEESQQPWSASRAPSASSPTSASRCGSGRSTALEQLAAESARAARADQEVLCAFVREPRRVGCRAARRRRACRPTCRPCSACSAARDRAGGRMARLDLRRTDLRGADLNGVHLRARQCCSRRISKHASLQGAHLAGADLRGAYLHSADLVEADLKGADLREAHLESAYMVEAHLEGADLGGAHPGRRLSRRRAPAGRRPRRRPARRRLPLQGHLEGASLHGARVMSTIGVHRDERERINRTGGGRARRAAQGEGTARRGRTLGGAGDRGAVVAPDAVCAKPSADDPRGPPRCSAFTHAAGRWLKTQLVGLPSARVASGATMAPPPARNERNVLLLTGVGHFTTHFFELMFPTLAVALARQSDIAARGGARLELFRLPVVRPRRAAGRAARRSDRRPPAAADRRCSASASRRWPPAKRTPARALIVCLAAMGGFAGVYHPVGMSLISRTIDGARSRARFNGLFGDAAIAADAGAHRAAAPHVGWQDSLSHGRLRDVRRWRSPAPSCRSTSRRAPADRRRPRPGADRLAHRCCGAARLAAALAGDQLSRQHAACSRPTSPSTSASSATASRPRSPTRSASSASTSAAGCADRVRSAPPLPRLPRAQPAGAAGDDGARRRAAGRQRRRCSSSSASACSRSRTRLFAQLHAAAPARDVLRHQVRLHLRRRLAGRLAGALGRRRRRSVLRHRLPGGRVVVGRRRRRVAGADGRRARGVAAIASAGACFPPLQRAVRGGDPPPTPCGQPPVTPAQRSVVTRRMRLTLVRHGETTGNRASATTAPPTCR